MNAMLQLDLLTYERVPASVYVIENRKNGKPGVRKAAPKAAKRSKQSA